MPSRRTSCPAELPEGFLYTQSFLNESEESDLLSTIRQLDFQPFEFQGYTAKRRIVEYGWEYDFTSRAASTTQPLPEFLLPFRDRAATFANLPPRSLVEAVVTEYPPGAPIGWHRDVPQFEVVLGISLAAPCRMRLKPYRAEGKLVSIILEPRSIYIMRGLARWKFQHSIPAVEALRYSITFRTLREKKSTAPLPLLHR
jgi:alkylated DNA repair dioxygenase AlkB